MRAIDRNTRLRSEEFRERVGNRVFNSLSRLNEYWGPWKDMTEHDFQHATIEDLATLTENECRGARAMGNKAIATLSEVLKEQGLDWGHVKPRPIIKPWVGLSDQQTVRQLLFEAAECLRQAAMLMNDDD
jgi:hypothetical protein